MVATKCQTKVRKNIWQTLLYLWFFFHHTDQRRGHALNNDDDVDEDDNDNDDDAYFSDRDNNGKTSKQFRAFRREVCNIVQLWNDTTFFFLLLFLFFRCVFDTVILAQKIPVVMR